MAGHWFDLQSSWAAASGVAPLPTCCRSFGSCGGSRRDFVLGCPLALSALKGSSGSLGSSPLCYQGLFLNGSLFG